MAKTGRIIKLSKNMRPFVSRVVRDGKVQKAFAAQIGIPVGACVAGAVHKNMSGAEIHAAVKKCAPAKGSIKLRY
jgi:hypothetical protein